MTADPLSLPIYERRRPSSDQGPERRPGLQLIPVSVQEAKLFVDRHHRHHRAPLGGLFAIGLAAEDQVVGVVIVGRPVARQEDDYTAEVTRLAVLEGRPGAASKLYAAAWRAARALGYRKLITYTLITEPGTSLRAAGWQVVGRTRPRSWHRPSRPRVDRYPNQTKLRWEVDA